MKNILNSSYKLKRFTSSMDKDFKEAVRIYNDVTPVETKTSIDEIIYFADKPQASEQRTLYFFGLYYNEQIIGYTDCAYLKLTKTILIDYISMKNEHRVNGIFYPLFFLLQQFFSDNLIDYDYMIIEVSPKTLKENVDNESYFLRMQLQFEEFGIIDIPYPQPKLGIKNFESNFHQRLMIKTTHPIRCLKSETLNLIVEDIYFNHYLHWYSNFLNQKELNDYTKHISLQLDNFRKGTKNRDRFYLKNISTIHDRILNYDSTHIKNSKVSCCNLLNILLAFIIIIISFAISFGGYRLLSYMDVSIEKITPFFSVISSIMISALTFFFTEIQKKK